MNALLIALSLICTIHGAWVAPGRADDLRRLRRDLRDEAPETRRRAVKRLAAHGGDAALDLVVGALADPDGQVADEAQVRLVDLANSEVLDRLVGRGGLRSKDPWVRVRAAEVLGRWPEAVGLARLTPGLDRRDPITARATCWSIERLARAGRLELPDRRDPWAPLVRLVERQALDPVRAAAISALGAAAPERALEPIARLPRRPGRETRVACLAVVLEAEAAGACAALGAALRDDEPSVRAAAARLAGRYADRDVLAELVGRLAVEPRACVRETVARALGQATGLKHGTHVKSWRRALEDLPSTWTTLAPAPQSAEAGPPAGQSVAAVGRFSLQSDRVALLVDFSGSLWNERADGTRRKDALDPEVEALLGSLPSEAEFFLVPFTAETHPFSDEPERATRRNVSQAQRFFRRATMRGKGDVWGAVELALAQPNIDRIVVVTDGAPTGGRRWDVRLMGELLGERTRFRPVVVDMILFDAPRGLQRRWAPVIAKAGGRLVCVER